MGTGSRTYQLVGTGNNYHSQLIMKPQPLIPKQSWASRAGVRAYIEHLAYGMHDKKRGQPVASRSQR